MRLSPAAAHLLGASLTYRLVICCCVAWPVVAVCSFHSGDVHGCSHTGSVHAHVMQPVSVAPFAASMCSSKSLLLNCLSESHVLPCMLLQ